MLLNSPRGVATLAAVILAAVTTCVPAAASDVETLGEPVSDRARVRIGELVAAPERWVDKPVVIVGLVDDVCPMKGCWVDVIDQQSHETIRVKVQDDVIVIPAHAKGERIVAEGILRKREMSATEAASWLAHLAEEKGEPFDEASVTGPMTFYQIEGSGLEVGGS